MLMLAGCGNAALRPSSTVIPRVSPAPTPAALSTLPAQNTLPPVDLHVAGQRACDLQGVYMAIGPRMSGTAGGQRAGDYIIQQARAAGWQVEEQRFAYMGTSVRNIIATPGSSTALLDVGIPAIEIIDCDDPQRDTSNDAIDAISAESLTAVGRALVRWPATRAQP